MERIVVTGVGAVTPIGNDAVTFWSNLRGGVSGVGPITAFEPADDLPVKIAAEVKDFDPKNHMDFKAARRMDRFSQFAVAAGGEALRDAEFEVTKENSTRVGVIINTGGGGIPAIVHEVLTHDRRGPARVSPFFIPMFAPNMAACQVSLTYGIRGPVLASVAACAAGAQAAVDGLHVLRRGEADVIIAGGTEAGLDPVAIAAFANMQALSRRNDDPERASRPFDKDRDGFVFAEGCGVVVLETESHAKARGARILCELVGGAMTADAFHITAPDPEGFSVTNAIRLALERSGMEPGEIDAVYAHATSTPLGDVAETRAIKQALGSRAHEIPISAPKSMVGHLVGASGAINAIAAVLSLRDQVMAPTINLVTPGAECDLDYVPNVERPVEIDSVMTNAFGFGGQNVVTIFRRYES